jgi:two-component system chemotaxis sensor kinase CheA
MSEMDEVVAEFLVESRENLDQLDTELVTLEQQSDPELVAGIFRAIHTIKGTSGFLGFGQLEAVTHVGENLLSMLRDGALTPTESLTTALLAMVDAVRAILDDIERTGAELPRDDSALVARLERLATGEAAPPAEPEVEHGTEHGVPVDAVEPTEPVEAEVPLLGELLVAEGAIDEEQLAAALHAQAQLADPAVPAGDSSIRVDVGLLDDLMNLVGELVLARNQILQFSHANHDSQLNATTQRLNLITTELQEGVMKTRMQPIENVWNKFPRVVRDLSMQCGKSARLVMEGKHTELDKTLLEAIKDPLTHLVRNAVDHGLEDAAGRAAAGKGEEGTVRLRAYHEGGQVIVEISDDGAGIDPERLRRKAVQKGLLTAEEADRRPDREMLNVIFLPGFSTADAVSNISGRGVGMDVVRTNIEAIGGSVDVHSVLGRGTTFKIKIPLTLAIIPALVVTARGDRYAIPQVSLLELVRLDGREAVASIEHVHGVPVYRLRGRLLPIVFLDEVFGDQATTHDEVNIVVLQAEDQQFGLVVDSIEDTAEIVVKPLGRLLKQVDAFAGATIMGDGRVALILDVLGIGRLAGVTGEGDRRVDQGADEGARAEEGDRRTVLLFGLGERRLALMLEMVARLEEFDVTRIEDAGTGRVVQYRDEILPLVYLADELDLPGAARPEESATSVQVVVYTEGDRSVGLVVEEIFDIVEQSLEVTSHAQQHGLLGSAVIQGRVTDVVDVRAVLRRALAGLFVEVAA